MGQNLNLEIINEVASKHDCLCLSEKYINSKQKLEWQCVNNHYFSSSFNMISKRENWCKECLKNEKSKILLEEIQNLALKKGGQCVSSKINNVKNYASFKCSEGHEWSARISSVKEGCWCNRCAIDKQRLSLSDFQKIAIKNGGECLSLVYKSVMTKMKFKCKNNHVWSTRPSVIKNGHWCPFCSDNMKKVIKK